MAKSIEHNIFPELTPRAELFEKVGLIEKAWLDQSSLGFPDNLVPLVNGLTFFRIKGVQALFEEKDDRLKAIGLPANLFAAMYNQAFPLVYVIQCRKSRIKVFLATNNSGSPCLSSLLESFLGLTLYETDTPANQWDMPGYAHCAALTGIPSYSVRGKLNKEQSTENPGIDHLILGLMREEWCYVVQAFPIRREQTSLWLESCAREIKDTNESFLLRDIQKSNRMASYYVEILEKSMNRLKWGKQQGLWQTGVYLFSKEPDTASQSAAILSSIFSGDRSTPEPIRCQTCMRSGNISPFVNCYNSKELKAFFSLPSREFPGFRLHEQSLFDVDFASNTEKSILIGQIMVNNQTYDYPASVSVDELTKHALVAGVTGSGKTNTIFNLLKDVYVSHQVPFLVIEPAKSEYKNLLQEISSLLVFTLGEEKPGISSPFRLNPFAFPDGVSLQTHIDYLKAVFNASFVMYAPMPYVLEECLYKIYEDKGWNLVTSTNFRGRTEASFPTLTDLYLKIDEVVENIGYQDRTTMDIKAALKTRIKNLCLGGKGMMLNTTSIISFDEIMARPTVLELKYLGNDEEKAFMMGLILIAVWEHYEFLQGRGQNITDGLKHLTIIEEAHRLLKNVPTEKTSEEQSNIKGKGVETFCNLLAEIRAYGEGVLVSEQIPAKLAPDVIKNSNLKIMHRMVAKEDRGLMGDTMNLDLHQKRQAVCLEVGEAIFFCEGLDRSLKVKIPLSGVKSQNAIFDNVTIHQRMLTNFYGKRQALLRKFSACMDCPYHAEEACEKTKREIEEILTTGHAEEIAAQFFIPYLLEPDRGDAPEYLRSIVDMQDTSLHCMIAHLISYYINARGNFYDWPYPLTKKLRAEAEKTIESGDFAGIVGVHCQQDMNKNKDRHAVCKAYCHYRCLFGYEGSILAKNPLVHNRLIDLLNSPEYGIKFYQELVILIVDFLREYVPIDQNRHLNKLAICYLIQKLNEHQFSLSLQRKILDEFVSTLAVVR